MKRICDEVRECLAEASGVRGDRDDAGVHVHGDLGAGFSRGLGEVLGNAVREHCEVDLLEIQRERSGLRQGHRGDVADEPLERLGVPEDRAQMVVVAGMDAVEHRLEPPAHDRKRRAQLMRDVGEERPSLGVDGTEAFAHRVERACERAHVPAASLGHACRIVASLDLLGRLDQRGDRSEPPARRAHDHHEAADAAHEDDERERAEPSRGRDRAERDERGPDSSGHDPRHGQQNDREHQREAEHEAVRGTPPCLGRGPLLVLGPPGRALSAAPRPHGLSLPARRPCGSRLRRRSASAAVPAGRPRSCGAGS